MTTIPTSPYDGAYRAIVRKGCGGYRDNKGDFYCGHNYVWECDRCPVLQDKFRPAPSAEAGDYICNIPIEQFDPMICADLGRWDASTGGPVNCEGCPHSKEVANGIV